jgi:16S rRNA (adenine1518-N6/adenine1519-N6)-dimethyltransferase
MNRAKRVFYGPKMPVKASKALGQNFLWDENIAADIAALANISPGERVWEIGPGLGILTSELISAGAQLTAFELDTRLEAGLRSKFDNSLDLRMQDILRADWPSIIAEKPGQLKIVANIPYHITSPLLALLEANHQHFSCVVLMLQKEVAERICASAGSKAYGLLSIRIQLLFDPELRIRVGRESFNPAPNVDSAVIVLLPRQEAPIIRNHRAFHCIIQAAFSHRRKTLRNNLLPIYGKDKLKAMEMNTGIDLSRRGESLDETEFIALSDSI